MSNLANQDFGSEDEDDDFNPAPAVDSDDEGDAQQQTRQSPARNEDDDDDDDDDSRPAAAKQRGSSNSNQQGNNADDDEDEEEGDDDQEDDDDDEEEEDEDDEDDVGHPRKRRRKGPRNQFLDVEAEVDDEDEEEPEEDDDLAAGDEMHPDDLLELPAGAERDDRKHRELDRQRDLAASMDAEKQAQALKERYGRNRAAHNDSAVVPQRLLLPSVDDPHIWRLKCKPGKEREVIFGIMKRVEDRAGTREPLQIISAFERSGPMSGNLYVEARVVTDVTSGLEGLQNVYMGTKPMLIPIGEMPDLLRTTKEKQLEPGMYVRVRRGKYQGDLAQIDEVESNGTEVTVRLIPRLDYGANEDILAGAPGDKRKRVGFGNSAGPKPPQRLFSEHEAKKRHSRYLTKGAGFSGNTWTYLNDTYVDGFLIKDFKTNLLQSEDVNPTLEEVTKFAADAEDGTENLDLSALAATIKSNTAGAFLPGDMVEIFQGEQRGVCGKAISVHSDIVRILVTEGPLKNQTIESPTKGLRKLFREGDHVKVIGGSKYFDEVGMVVKIIGDRITMLTDSNQVEITVFSKDLREATDSGGQVGVSKYDLHDLVQLDASTVACVTKVDRESLRVLDQTGTVRSLLFSNISNKLERRRNAVATDADGNEIRIDDGIKENGGENKQGRVLHIHRNFLFAHNREQTDNAGVFVVRTNSVKTVAAKGGRIASAASSLLKMNPAMQRQGAGGQQGATGMPPPRSMGRDRLIGKTVTIRRGPHKGLLGIVKDSTDLEARVEIHGSKKTINISKENLTVRDPVTGDVIQQDASRRPGAPPSGMGGMPGGRTSYGGATPGGAFGRTPRNDGGRTPAWAGAGGGNKTPAWQAGSGNRTAYGGSVPAWQRSSNTGGATAYGGSTAYGGGAGSATAYGGSTSYGGSTAYGGGTWNPNTSRTPFHSGGTAFDSGSKTPAYNAYEAPTPGFNNAPTPGNLDAPTPGAGYGHYQTPGAGAPTPGGFPSTPGAWNAETPAADDGPRYD